MVTERQRNPWLILLVLCFGFFRRGSCARSHRPSGGGQLQRSECPGIKSRTTLPPNSAGSPDSEQLTSQRRLGGEFN